VSEALWALGRGTALVMFTITLVLGIVSRSGRSVGGLGRFGVNEIHRTAALTGTTLIGVHVASLFFDPYAQLRLVDVVLPFLGAYRPVWLGLGTLALDLLAVITVVSLLREKVGPRVFRAVHWGTYLLWPVALAHAIGNGTDSASIWMLGIAAACTASVVAAVGWRLTPSYAERGWDRTPRKVTP
jgi:sulfoxide reductase heme-binding subunit YedZ